MADSFLGPLIHVPKLVPDNDAIIWYWLFEYGDVAKELFYHSFGIEFESAFDRRVLERGETSSSEVA
jgi:hypothetical protein